ncbi:MAG: helix-turn-helix transcriptional regulator [Candidatus Dormibacteria bacterium]|jgi:DNA-binding transcriptional ArsR family regulator|nr:transcriptional regulator [Chloroflexota bacterium]HBV93142.1 transcriptional regulator [Chloroflexota bacterium]
MTVKLTTASEAAPPDHSPPHPANGGPDLHPHPDLHPGVVGVLEALADPMRMAIVRRLASGVEYPCGWLGLPISKSTLTHHLHVLHHAGIVVKREEGTRRMISLDRAGMESRFPGLLDAVLGAPDPEAVSET